MQVPLTTIVSFLGTQVARGVLHGTAEGVAEKSRPDLTSLQKETLGVVAGGLTAASALAVGNALRGFERPNTFARGLVWAGGVGAAFTILGAVGLAISSTRQ